MKGYVSWEQYCALPPEEQQHVKVINFTGVTEITETGLARPGTLGVEQSAGGSSAPVSDDEAR